MKSRITSKGMTLLEIIVVMAIICILIIPIGNLIINNQNLSNRIRDLSMAKDIALTVQQYVVEEVKMANAIKYVDAIPAIPTETNVYSLFIHNNELIKQDYLGQDIILSQDYFYPYKIYISYTKGLSDKITNLAISVNKMRRGIEKEIYVTRTSVKSINMFNGSINGTTGNIVEYIIPTN